MQSSLCLNISALVSFTHILVIFHNIDQMKSWQSVDKLKLIPTIARPGILGSLMWIGDSGNGRTQENVDEQRDPRVGRW